MKLLISFLIALAIVGISVLLIFITNIAIERFPTATVIAWIIIVIVLATLGIYLG